MRQSGSLAARCLRGTCIGLLAKLGMPLGELWRLGPLSRHMKKTGSWDAFISVKPLNITGGTGSPANATALT